MRLSTDTRGASIAITHAMTIGITSILIMALMLSSGTYLESQQQTVAHSQATEVSGDVASLIDAADQLNRTGDNVTATFDPTYPAQIAGSPYTIYLEQSGSPTSGTLRIETQRLSYAITVAVNTTTQLEESAARGENPSIHLCHDESTDEQYIELRRCSR